MVLPGDSGHYEVPVSVSNKIRGAQAQSAGSRIITTIVAVGYQVGLK